MRRATLLIGLLGLLGLSGCGSSSKSTTTTSAASAERIRLTTQLRSELESPSSPLADARDLDECVVAEAKGVPLATLRALVSSSSDPAQADPVLARCVAQGKGVAFFRRQIAASATSQLKTSATGAGGPQFINCMVGGVDRLSAAQLAVALDREATGDRAYSRRLGQQIALTCIQQPGVFEEYRKQWLTGLRNTLERGHLPPAFVRCVLSKAGHIQPAELTKLFQASTAQQNAYGQKLGRACRAGPSA